MAGPAPGVFSSEPFLRVMNDSWFDGRGRVGDVAVGGHVVRTLVVGDQPALDAAFVDFFVPLTDAAPEWRGRYAPRVATSTHPASEYETIDSIVTEPAPFVRWEAFGSWGEVQDHWKGNEKGIVRESRRRAARLRDRAGDLRFTFDDRRVRSLDMCLAWKSAQFVAGGLPDPFTDRREGELLRALHAEGIAVLSTLEAGDRLVAAHLGLDWDGTMHWWLPTYDRDVSWASPGRLLLEWVIQHSYERGDSTFDFLRGGSSYKWNYATDFRIVTEVGRRPLRRRIDVARARAVRRHPRLADAGRSTRDVILRRNALRAPRRAA